MSPETFESFKQLAQIVAAGAVSALGAWKLAAVQEQKKKRNRSHEQRSGDRALYGPPDNTLRDITRKEWHDVNDLVNSAIGKTENLGMVVAQNVKNIAEIRGKLDGHIDETRDGLQSVIRLEEQFKAFREAWGSAGMRAEEDRRLMGAQLEQIRARLFEGQGR